METKTYLRGIYNQVGQRVGMDRESGAVFKLTTELANESPVGNHHKISDNFKVIRLGRVWVTILNTIIKSLSYYYHIILF